ncbi:hypothetical protein [Kineococcus aurantiacus]|uniref:Antibiotic biosynthesis monooxygenase n=1 Tax=Kineococcus aurantiacus TaxID=37633 RepID=A0A7Y9J0C2_9ACTN|nr:hypothetical protein [Kineococcus aurantiacus]NYD22207.1 hypothetical protein [Kineococcus aurantiacus]
MTYGIVVEVAAPAEAYDAIHSAVVRESGPRVDGLLLHVCRSIDSGFQVIEVWNSREECDRYTAQVLGEVMGAVLGQYGREVGPPVVQEFDVRGLVLPAAGIAR